MKSIDYKKIIVGKLELMAERYEIPTVKLILKLVILD